MFAQGTPGDEKHGVCPAKYGAVSKPCATAPAIVSDGMIPFTATPAPPPATIMYLASSVPTPPPNRAAGVAGGRAAMAPAVLDRNVAWAGVNMIVPKFAPPMNGAR